MKKITYIFKQGRYKGRIFEITMSELIPCDGPEIFRYVEGTLRRGQRETSLNEEAFKGAWIEYFKNATKREEGAHGPQIKIREVSSSQRKYVHRNSKMFAILISSYISDSLLGNKGKIGKISYEAVEDKNVVANPNMVTLADLEDKLSA